MNKDWHWICVVKDRENVRNILSIAVFMIIIWRVREVPDVPGVPERRSPYTLTCDIMSHIIGTCFQMITDQFINKKKVKSNLNACSALNLEI